MSLVSKLMFLFGCPYILIHEILMITHVDSLILINNMMMIMPTSLSILINEIRLRIASADLLTMIDMMLMSQHVDLMMDKTVKQNS